VLLFVVDFGALKQWRSVLLNPNLRMMNLYILLGFIFRVLFFIMPHGFMFFLDLEIGFWGLKLLAQLGFIWVLK
jgi:hypothetical protein